MSPAPGAGPLRAAGRQLRGPSGPAPESRGVLTTHEHLEAVAQRFRIGTEASVVAEVYREGAVDGHVSTLSRAGPRAIRHKLAF